VEALKLKHVVITMVARDDLPDGGAQHLKRVVESIRSLNRDVTIELLTSDFQGSKESLALLLENPPEIFNHNVETVRRLTPRVRHRATYDRSLEILSWIKKESPQTLTKSGLMLGLGEQENEVVSTLSDLHQVGVQIVTMGQYLQPTSHHLLVKAFIPPETFDALADQGRALGIPYIFAGPFVRSSYNAGVVFRDALRSLSITSD
jgi:lipoic acid synthetase